MYLSMDFLHTPIGLISIAMIVATCRVHVAFRTERQSADLVATHIFVNMEPSDKYWRIYDRINVPCQ